MKKKTIALVMTVLFLCSIFNTNTVNAATCSSHSNYQDTVTSVYSWLGNPHDIGTGLYVGTIEITVKCNTTVTEKNHSITCGVCGIAIREYLERNESHSRSH